MEVKSQGAKLSMDKLREMMRLHELGRNQSKIARSCNMARSTVQDYLRRATTKDLSDEQLQQLSDSEVEVLLGKGKRQGRPRSETIDFAPVHQELERKGITLALL